MNKILLITGASSEVGIKLASSIYNHYSAVFLQYRNMNNDLEKIINTIKRSKITVIPLKYDLCILEDVHDMIEKIKNSKMIPNNIVHFPAPKAYNKQFHKDRWENFYNGWEISVHSIVEILKVFLPFMIKQYYGRIVFMLTSYTKNNPPKYQSSYVTVKYALLGLMKSLAVEYADKGITINGISPNMMETKFLSALPSMIIEKNAQNSPIRRNVYVDEILPIISYMLSDVGAAMIGQNICINGGLNEGGQI